MTSSPTRSSILSSLSISTLITVPARRKPPGAPGAGWRWVAGRAGLAAPGVGAWQETSGGGNPGWAAARLILGFRLHGFYSSLSVFKSFFFPKRPIFGPPGTGRAVQPGLAGSPGVFGGLPGDGDLR